MRGFNFSLLHFIYSSYRRMESPATGMRLNSRPRFPNLAQNFPAKVWVLSRVTLAGSPSRVQPWKPDSNPDPICPKSEPVAASIIIRKMTGFFLDIRFVLVIGLFNFSPPILFQPCHFPPSGVARYTWNPPGLFCSTGLQ